MTTEKEEFLSRCRNPLQQALSVAVSDENPEPIYRALAQWCEQQEDYLAEQDDPDPQDKAALATVRRVTDAYEEALAFLAEEVDDE